MSDHYDTQRETQHETQHEKIKSSPGLIALLKRNGVKATGYSVQDLKLAKKFMPVGYLD